MNPKTLTILMLGGLLLPSCTADGDVDSSESNLTMASSRSKLLHPSIAVPTNNDIGAAITTIIARETSGAAIYRTRTAADCTIDEFSRGDRHVATREVCDDLVVLKKWDGQELEARYFSFVWADHDRDGRVDSYDDVHEGGVVLNDENHDGRVDRMIVSVASLGDTFVVEGYGEWIPPAFPANRILADTDFDGRFETESVTGGDDPDGWPSWWTKP